MVELCSTKTVPSKQSPSIGENLPNLITLGSYNSTIRQQLE
jgi:hypothetical protein